MLNVVRAWIVFSAAMCSAGWLLSWLHQLNAAGYAAVLALLGAGAMWWGRAAFCVVPWRSRWGRLISKRRRFRRWLPLGFIVLSLVIVLGAIGHPPAHTDGLQYRTPRVLSWLAAGQWHWIHAWDNRLNVISCGFEWLTAPLLVFTRTARGLFVINVLSYLMLPGLIFGVLSQLGVRRRVAWQWMWILPTGWVYCMQAGGIGNDHFSTVYSLAAVYFAMRARKTGRLADLWISLLACALTTGTKQTNVPLALLWLIAAWPVLRLAWQRPLLSLGVAVLALFASGVPSAYLDIVHTGYWTGWSKEQSLQPASPFWGIVGNGMVLLIYNFMPPVVPFSHQWHEMRARFLESPAGEPFTSFEMFASVPRAITEQTAALGVVVSGLLLVAFIAGRRKRGLRTSDPSNASWLSAPRLIRGTSWCLLLLFMSKVGSWNAPRYLASYYPFLLPTMLLGPGAIFVARSRWWRWASVSGVMLTVLVLVLSRQRPVWPADYATAVLERHFPESSLVRKVRNAYLLTQNLWAPLDEALLKKIPREENVIGYATRTGRLDRQLWFPLGRHRVEYVKVDDPPARLRQMGVTYLLVDRSALADSHLRLEDWLQRYDAELVASVRRDFGAELPLIECHLLRLRSSPSPTSK